MDQYMNNLFPVGTDIWRIEAFIRRIEQFKRECVTNEQEQFMCDALYHARALLTKRLAEQDDFVTKT